MPTPSELKAMLETVQARRAKAEEQAKRLANREKELKADLRSSVKDLEESLKSAKEAL